VVTPEDKIVGFASVGEERTGIYGGELYAIYLFHEYQRKGIGNY
jgi:GNAT superfamily N-acetyltransferase